MSQSKGFDMSKMDTGHKILLGAGIAYLIVLFLPWQRVCIDLGLEIPGASGCASASGASGIGVINLLLVIALLAWEGMALAGVDINAPKQIVSAGLAGAIVVFTILKILVDSESIYLFAWIGLILAVVIGYGGWLRWQAHQASGGASGMGGGGMPAPPPGGMSG
ncbi:MAG TPA: hypothetical protein VFK59_07710 [Actinomycetota bacterium]|jgi:hypothetical protein|nr:hypothetical protein [Actinomycetota bacterium]